MYPRNTPLSLEEKEEIRRVYLETGNQQKVAKITKHSNTTIYNVLKSYGLNKGQGGNQSAQIKISDDELRLEVERNPNAQVIAEKYGMSIERVCRRCSKLGLKVNGSSRRWKQRAKFYGCNEIDPSITLDRLRQRDNDICQICGEVVDISDRTGKHIGARYPSCDHIIPLSKGGTHTWNNVQLAHMGCNAGKCNRIITV